ncbi:MAG: DNA mismatch repair endonuclease MutL [Clostridiaceae bacterium]
MSRINILDDNTSNKIAAGEVVERPSSVVKELVENSIDAKAKNIIIEIKNGGETYIKVLDDGEGIHKDDIESAFLTHGTSKIKSIDDIYSISTMGFRGEALPSIAAVSKVVLKSRCAEFDFGREISISGGYKDYIKDIGFNIGTSIEISDLFYNVPARLKFLKSPRRESALISDIVTRIALANKNIAFTLINNDKKVITTYGTDNSNDTVLSLYGKNIYENVFYFEGHRDTMSVYGYLGNEELSRGSRNYQSIFVNKRYVKSKFITAAVENAFKSFLTINKFPFFVLFIDIYPEFIDVNVHPTKLEIKFNNEREVFKIVFEEVHKAIKNSKLNSFRVEEPNFVEDTPKLFENTNIEYGENKNLYNEKQDLINNIKSHEKTNSDIYKIRDGVDKKDIPDVIDIPIDLKREIVEDKRSKLPEMRVIGQFNKTYILCEYEETLFLIDQHAAHEKVLFEKYLDQINQLQVTAQILISPVVLDLSYEDINVYIENKEIFSQSGFLIEIFGNNSICIKEVPMFLGKPELSDLFMQILNNIKELKNTSSVYIKYNKIATLACKAAVKANQELNTREVESLLNELGRLEDPFNCPHGRPTIIKFSLNELEKRFKRIQ